MATDEERKLMALHAEAKTALLSGRRIVGAASRFQALAKMSPTLSKSAEYHEAFILLALAGRAKPARAHGRMGQLKKLRVAAGQESAFDKFEQMIETHSDVYFSPHGFLTQRLGDVAADDLYQGVHDIVAQLKSLGYDTFANSGTLLGLVRDKAPIAYDDDVDLGVILKATSDEAAAKEFWALSQNLAAEGIDARPVDADAPIIKLPKIAGFEVDLFPAYGTRKGYKIYPYSYGALTKFDVLPLQRCPVSGLPIPARAETVLAQNYGAGWITPDSRFVFPWQRQNRRFAKLLKAYKDAKG